LRSRWTWTGIAATAVAFGGLLGFQGEPQASTAEGKISQQVMLDTAGGEETSFIIYMGEQADLSAASQIADEHARGRYVYSASGGLHASSASRCPGSPRPCPGR